MLNNQENKYRYTYEQYYKLSMGTANTPLCVDSSGHQTFRWCNYQATDNMSIIVQYTFIVVVLIFLFVISAYYSRLLKYRREGFQHIFGSVFDQVFLVLFLWLACSLIKVSINIYIYNTYMKDDFHYTGLQPSQYQPVTSNSLIFILSAIYNIPSGLSTYIAFHLMLMIPYRWLSTGLMSVSEKRLQGKKIQLRFAIQRYFKFFQLVRIYYRYIRVIFIIFLLSQPVLLYLTSFGCSLPHYNHIFYSFQGTLILIIYIIGLCASNFLRKNKLIIINKSDYRRIRLQYFLLLMITIIRLSSNIYVRYFSRQKYRPNRNCSDTNLDYQVQMLIFIIILLYVNHVGTVLILLFIYRPNVQFQEKRSQMILVQQQSQECPSPLRAKKEQQSEKNSINQAEMEEDEEPQQEENRNIQEKLLSRSNRSKSTQHYKSNSKDKNKQKVHQGFNSSILPAKNQ